jgi:hypothetical protein
MFETVLETIVGFGYTGWVLAFLLVGAVRWSDRERRFFAGRSWPYLE